MDKPLLFFRNSVEGVTKFKAPSRPPGDLEEEIEEEKNYEHWKNTFKISLTNYIKDVKNRTLKRNKAIIIPSVIDFIEIHFYGYFKVQEFDNKYRKQFGLSPVLYKDYNKTVIFAVLDSTRFENFIKEIEKFINSENLQLDYTNYKINRNIFFIKEFYFYDSTNRKNYSDTNRSFEISVFENVELSQNITKPYLENLVSYLKEKNINFDLDGITNSLIINEIKKNILIEIEDNFDIVMSINSADAGIIRPTEINLPIREFGFSVKQNGELPIIGIIDTGVSNNNPLKDIIINTNDYDITKSNALIDNVNHGTAIACFASLGSKVLPEYRGNYDADALILSIKIFDTPLTSLSYDKIVSLIRKANKEFNVKIFTLAIGYEENKKYNELIRDYSYHLDLLSRELDILIFISTGNYNKLLNPTEYAKYFEKEETNLNTPADSMNNISVGSISDNLEASDNIGRFTPFNEYPSSFTKKLHLKFFDESLKYSKLKNRLFRKPDIVIPGGDFNDNVGIGDKFAIKTLSSKKGMYYDREIGTSYSVGIAANMAAKIVKKYPELSRNMQTVKALLINSCQLPEHISSLQRLFGSKDLMYMTTGYGIPNEYYSYNCDENNATFILEDEVLPGEIKVFPIKLPEYINILNFDRNILEFNATLCFSFEPVKNNQMAYCPIHMKFGFFKNLPLEEYQNGKSIGINDNKSENYAIKKTNAGWSQDYYYQSKFLSNTQSKEYRFKKSDIINESNQFKIAITSKIHKLLSEVETEKYKTNHKFSLVVTIRELPNENKKVTGLLYDELKLTNNLEAIGIIEAEAELQNE
jgi:hypothetical protein